MKKSPVNITVPVMIFVLCFTAVVPEVNGQTGRGARAPIPEDVNKIFQTSCMPCHWKNGGRLPGAKLNFSRWSGYDAARQAEKAAAICSAVRKGTMPPRRIKETNPELIPTKEQAELICKWADSLKKPKGKK